MFIYSFKNVISFNLIEPKAISANNNPIKKLFKKLKAAFFSTWFNFGRNISNIGDISYIFIIRYRDACDILNIFITEDVCYTFKFCTIGQVQNVRHIGNIFEFIIRDFADDSLRIHLSARTVTGDSLIVVVQIGKKTLEERSHLRAGGQIVYTSAIHCAWIDDYSHIEWWIRFVLFSYIRGTIGVQFPIRDRPRKTAFGEEWLFDDAKCTIYQWFWEAAPELLFTVGQCCILERKINLILKKIEKNTQNETVDPTAKSFLIAFRVSAGRFMSAEHITT